MGVSVFRTRLLPTDLCLPVALQPRGNKVIEAPNPIGAGVISGACVKRQSNIDDEERVKIDKALRYV